MAKTEYTFSVIILSHNTSKVLKNCLDSLYNKTKNVNFEVIVVDHNSHDDSLKMLSGFKKQHRNFTLIEKKDNPGFGFGNNSAAKMSSGKYLILLNSDTLFLENTLKNIEDKIDSYTDLGIYSIKLLNKDGSFQASGGSFPTLKNLFFWQLALDDIPLFGDRLRSFHPKENSIVYKNNGPEWVTGAFMVIPKPVYDTVHGFDENIFMYTEEMEMAYRITSLGKRVVYDQEEKLIHLGGASGGSYLALTSEVKNIIYFWHKHRPAWQLPVVKILLASGSLLRLLFFGIIKQNESSKKAYRECFRLSL